MYNQDGALINLERSGPGSPITRLIYRTWVTSNTEDDHIAAFDIADAEAVCKFIDKDALLVGESRHHAGAFDFYRLINKDDQHDRDQDGKRQIA